MSEVAKRWKEQGVACSSATQKDLERLEQRYSIQLPSALAALYLLANGMIDGGMDDLLIRFWPIWELKRATEEIAEADPQAYKGFFVFADYSLWAHGYGIRLDDAPDAGTIAIVGSTQPIPVASSFVQFLENYLRHPNLIFGTNESPHIR